MVIRFFKNFLIFFWILRRMAQKARRMGRGIGGWRV
jgi:hypothetical protein